MVPIAALAAGLWAAGPVVTPKHITSVVRSDPRTGKLIRTVVVTPRVVGERKVAETVVPEHAAGPAAAADAASAETGLDRLVQSVAAQNSLPPELIHSVIKVESNYNPYAISPKGALGLMQLIPSTAERFGVADVFNPAQNIQGGARYLKYLLDLYNGDYALALAAYNAGEAAVAKYGGIPPYVETRNYVEQVHRQFEKSVAAGPLAGRHDASGGAACSASSTTRSNCVTGQREAASKQQTPSPAAARPQAPAHIQEIVQADGMVRLVSR